ncbi:hypothetical protein MLD38_017747 [Melastoma candidum]|uniref:Uncharacterized protein n=1 Tax=Melastoma candidum TaxID=119954 RepID=A0ACB9QVR2_9MYRT|nr:hypothetical protein MLD38_017747 [Melastoma candidum]
MTTTACFMIVSRNYILIYEAEVRSSAVKVTYCFSSRKPSLRSLYRVDLAAATMDKLIDAVMRNLPKACSATISARCTREFVEEQLETMFPVFKTPDHPPYSLMIQEAIKKLKEEGGSSEDSISKCIASKHDGLSWAHDCLLSHHLRKLCDGGEIVCTSNDRYMLPFFDGKGSVPPDSTKEKFKRGRGKKRGMHAQNKRLKRGSSLEGRDLEAEFNMKQRGTEIEADFGHDETSQLDVRISLQESELATKENTPIKGNEQVDSLSQGPQYQSTRETNQAAESINGEPVVETVLVSDERCTVTGKMPMHQDVQVADHDESDEQDVQLHDVIMAQRDPGDPLIVTVEDTEQSLDGSGSRNRTVEEPPWQSQADDFPKRCDSTENRSQVVEGQSEKSQSPELIFQHILMLQIQLRDSAMRLKQLDEAPGNGTLPRENVVEVYRRNREIGLIFQEMLEDSPETASGLRNRTIRAGKAGFPSKDLSTTGDGAARVRFPILRCQQQDRPPLFLDSCPRIPDDESNDLGDPSSGEQKQPELSKQLTKSQEQDILRQNSGDKLLGSPHMCMAALPVLACPEKTLRPPQPDLRPGQLKGEQACPDESALQCDHRFEQGFELSKPYNGREDDANNSRPLELPIHEAAEESSGIELQQTATKSMTEMRDDGFSPDGRSDFTRRFAEQPQQNELERDNTMTIASLNLSPSAAPTSAIPSIREKRRYKKRDKPYINMEYREKLRSPAIQAETRSTGDGPALDNSWGLAIHSETRSATVGLTSSDNSRCPAIHADTRSTMDGPASDNSRSPAIQTETRSTTGGPTSNGSSQYPVPKKRRGRPRKVTSPQETITA